MVLYNDPNWEKVDKILDYLIGLGGFDELFGEIDDETFKDIQKSLYEILKDEEDPQDD